MLNQRLFFFYPYLYLCRPYKYILELRDKFWDVLATDLKNIVNNKLNCQQLDLYTRFQNLAEFRNISVLIVTIVIFKYCLNC
jgi:hypothetical protein